MGRRLSGKVARQLRTLFTLGATGNLSDAQLLDRFLSDDGEASEAAFAALMQRHGRMVLGVCRRVLGDRHEAEDAFQATFMILARKAASLLRHKRLANWLHGVARHTAREARARTTRRKDRERRALSRRPISSASRAEEPSTDDLRALLDEELSRLPEGYRSALILCELEGLTRAQAAARLGIPEGTLSSRLARAKLRLRDRLARRGLSLTVSALATALAIEAPAAVVPTVLIETTLQAAALVAAGTSLAGAVSASVFVLTQGALQAMFFAKLKGAALGLAALTAVATGTIVLGQQDPNGFPIRSWSNTVTQADDIQSNRRPPLPRRRELPENNSPNFVKLLDSPQENLPEPPKASSDRLDALERKLDRILEALERSTSTTKDLRLAFDPEADALAVQETKIIGPFSKKATDAAAKKATDAAAKKATDAAAKKATDAAAKNVAKAEKATTKAESANQDQSQPGTTALRQSEPQVPFDRAVPQVPSDSRPVFPSPETVKIYREIPPKPITERLSDLERRLGAVEKQLTEGVVAKRLNDMEKRLNILSKQVDGSSGPEPVLPQR